MQQPTTFYRTCAALLIGCTLIGWLLGSALWGAVAGLVADIALLMWGGE
jgi:hypothetical protein